MNTLMLYSIIFIVLFLLLNMYFKIADKFNIIDKPNQRSSHTSITLRGGGIIFPISLILWFILNDFQYPFLSLGVTLIATISFLDDIITLSTKPRLLIHLLSVILVLYDLGFADLDWWTWVIGIILIIGWLNTFNFMDGINGITVLYAAAVLTPLYLINQDLQLIDEDLYVYVGLSLIVFGFFNLRKKAKTFAGDVGSISLGLIIAFLLIGLMLATAKWEYILFVSVYGIDSVLTIIQRLLKKENIFEAHRSHLYHLFANDMIVPHLVVSIAYGILQLSISLAYVYLFMDGEFSGTSVIISLLLISVLYILLKRSVIKRAEV